MHHAELSCEELRSLPPRPPSLPAASPKRRFVKLGRKTSDGSQQSASSIDGSSASRSSEGVAVRQPTKNRIRRQTNRLSGVFLRGSTASATNSGSMALTAGIRASLSIQARKGSMVSAADALGAEDPAELSNQITAPGILKIFGNEICEGAHYKSVLATTHSSAKELVKEALERYGLGKEEAESYVMCDTIGSTGDHWWRTEGFRVVGDNEKPLILQSLWKPREGLARRFEIQRRSSIEEKTSRDKDTVTAGINAQARKLQKSRSRVTSTLIERRVGRGHKLWRSKSEMDLLDSDSKQDGGHDKGHKDRSGSLNQTPGLSYGEHPEQNRIHGTAVPSGGNAGPQPKTETLCPPPRSEREGEESEREETEREETESSDDNTTQYSIHPPHDCPYLLLLQGCSLAQDFVIYLLVGPNVVFGRRSDPEGESKPDILLYADDILLKHCIFNRHGVGGPTTLRPCQDAVVTRNGEVLRKEVQLNPGDVIGLGQRYLFLFKDPLASTHKEVNSAAPEPSVTAVPWMLGHTSVATTTSHTGEVILCNTCIATCAGLQSSNGKRCPNRGLSFLNSAAERHGPTLEYDSKDEDHIVKEIVAMGRTDVKDRPPLTVAFLLCLCVQYSSARLQTSDLRRLLLLLATGVQSAIWEHTKELAAVQTEDLSGEGSNPEDLRASGHREAISGLRPLVVWMSNSLELLHFIQYQLPRILERRTRNEQGQEVEGGRGDDENKEEENLALLELRLACVRSASEETMSVLEEVVMLAFQQCVYYITKVLYPVLPALLDCNPFRESPDPHSGAQIPGGGGLQVPGEIQHLVDVLAETWRLLSDCQLHPEISSQLIGYLFYFINASLFNSLMERGSEPGFYQWSRGVHMRANLDLLLDWAHAAGLGDLALENTHTLSSAINLLATPRKNLLQTSWVSLRSNYLALSPAQLNHLLSLYSPASPCRYTWTPSAHDQTAAHETAGILESFDTHHPLVLPDGGYQFQLGRQVTDPALRDQLDRLKDFMSRLSASRSEGVTAAETQEGETFPTEKDILPEESLETLDSPRASGASPPSPPSPPSPSSSTHLDDFSSNGALLLSHKLRTLELQGRETGETRRSALDPSCLFMPPNTPHGEEPVDLVTACRDKWLAGDSESLPWSSGEDAHDEGGLVFECLAALKVDRFIDCANVRRFVDLKEEEEEEEEADDHYDDNNDEVFSLELQRGERGLGLALVDTRDTSLRVKGIFIRAVVPDSPAARCEKLVPGDRILAVNGVSLLGRDYQSGKELIQASGDRLRLLVARSHWMATAIQTEC